MSTDKDNTRGAVGDRPVLFGPPNDPALADRIGRLTGPTLEGAIARLQAFSDDVFGDGEEDPDPFGAEEPGAESRPGQDPVRVPSLDQDVPEGDEAAADGLDQILDALSEDEVQDAGGVPQPSRRSLLDVQADLADDEPVLSGPISPIAEVLARKGEAADGPLPEYVDPGLMGTDVSDPDHEEGAYDPLGDLVLEDPYDDEFPESDEADRDDEAMFADGDLFDDQRERAGVLSEDGSDPSDPGRAGVANADEPGPFHDPDDLPEEELVLFKGRAAAETDEELTGAGAPPSDERGVGVGSGADFGLPEPSPFGDRDGMGWGLYSDGGQEPDPHGGNPDRDGPEDWLTPEAEANPIDRDETDPVRHPAPLKGSTMPPSGESALDALITDLRWTGDERAPVENPGQEAVPVPDRPDETAGEPNGKRLSLLPSFLRRDGHVRPRLGDLPASPAAEPAPAAEAEPDIFMGPAPGEESFAPAEPETPVADPESAPETASDPEREERRPRRRLLAGVALIALIGAAGAAVWMMNGSDLGGRIADASGGAAVTMTGTATPDAPEERAGVTPAAAEQGAPSAPAGPVEGGAADAAAAQTPTASGGGVSPEVADLLAEIGRGAPATEVAPSEELLALQSRLEGIEAESRAAQERAERLSGEMTGLTDQITGLLQRDSDQAERIDRMERLIRGQSAILAQFGQMEESLEQTQVVLLDVSARIGAVEGQNPADRDAVNRALSDIESRLQALTANMSILARMSIEGVDALRAPNASAGSVGVQTAPQTSDQRSGGADPVFRTETGGFRISSDAAGRVPPGVKKDDFIEGYGYVLDVLPASDGQRLVVMENGSVLIPAAN